MVCKGRKRRRKSTKLLFDLDLAILGLGEVSKAMVYKMNEENDNEQAAKVRMMACWVMSTIAQNNPTSQDAIIKQGVLPIVIAILEQSKHQKVTQKALAIVSGSLLL